MFVRLSVRMEEINSQLKCSCEISNLGSSLKYIDTSQFFFVKIGQNSHAVPLTTYVGLQEIRC